MIQFRTATIDDAARIATLVNSAYRGDSSKKGWTTEADFLDGLRTDEAHVKAMIEEPLNQIEIAESEAGMVGSVHLKKENADTLYFGMLTVNPELQAGGVGKRMIEHVESIAKKWGCTRIRITVIHLRSELIEYYKRRGFEATGAFEKFPDDDPVFGIPKTELKLLEFVKKL